MKRFKSAGQAQPFLAAHDQIANLFRRPADTNAADDRRNRGQAFRTWAGITLGRCSLTRPPKQPFVIPPTAS
jgi:putative transposase